MSELGIRLESALALPAAERVAALIEMGRRALEAEPDQLNGTRDPLVGALLEAIGSGAGTRTERLEIGEILGLLGDPRLHTPSEPEYWVRVPFDHGAFQIGKFAVTNLEYRRFVEAGGYENRSLWSDEGWAWLDSCEDPWPVKANGDGAAPFVVPNQPVVGVTLYEAEAYARFCEARLPRFDERLWVVRGAERRPYPWGSPFGTGNANTREEVLGRPCAVGLYVHDRTPEGVCDLAGNAAEWTGDGAGAAHWVHPGAWDQPSMAAWAKARSLEPPHSRWAGLGMRLARDAS